MWRREWMAYLFGVFCLAGMASATENLWRHDWGGAILSILFALWSASIALREWENRKRRRF